MATTPTNSSSRQTKRSKGLEMAAALGRLDELFRAEKILGMEPRPCDFCLAFFTPRRTQEKEARFCSVEHREAFWSSGQTAAGARALRAFRLELRAAIREQLQEELRAATANLRKQLGLEAQ